MSPPKSPFTALGYLLLGLGTLSEIKAYYDNKRSGGVGAVEDQFAINKNYHPGLPLPGENARVRRETMMAKQAILSGSRLYSIASGDINRRVSFIQQRINKDSLNPRIIEAARTIVSRKCGTRGNAKWCLQPKDFAGEVKAIYQAVQDPNSRYAMRYVRDHAKVDQFTAADKAIRMRAEDCDGGTIVLGSLLMSIGYPIRLRVIQDTSSSTWSHIYVLVGLPPTNPSVWVPLDWSVYPFKPAGWQAPGADQAKRTGRPAGIVARVKDFDV